MPMNVKPIPTLDPRINEIRELTARIVNQDILPTARVHAAGGRGDATASERSASKGASQKIKLTVKAAGLWAPHLAASSTAGPALRAFLEHAYMNEVLAYTTGGAGLFGVVAPNSGNQTILLKYGTEAQKRKWLVPLTEGKMESGFSMTEPDSPGSDPRSIKTTARLEDGEWVINGHKWFTSNGRRADFLIVMCRTEGEGSDTGRMTQIIVPTKTPGVRIVRGVEVWGRTSDHCEIVYDNVRVPEENALGEAGSGHKAAQDRLGAGRVFHCMNSIGQMWRAFDLMVERAAMREVHGGVLASKQFVQGFIADSYIDIQAARLMTIRCAQLMEDGGDPRTDISAIKVFVPAAYTRVVDRAIQVWGAAGVSGDLPLAGMYLGARTLRIADGPDEVHRVLIARNVLAQYAGGEGWDFGN